ncbi:DNA topoisomerase I [Orientia tsutsugamushi str. Gilliam]|uniref:DNA topoisomerase 1 n=1 Tax=Orientia tsutsugamushi str. Gilliam TaxID=1359184 RepID=A0A0F3M643_ORITS|nr:type I DNA topoisomerase [Orientia tsutsugamushi]KJV51116.1 DNA topoisomerase I [Orientia tsutsugamushi str. Gilliam]SPR03813.1 DNA topoisomerase I [Orientia tsutsugamushi str. Gilliam]
MKLLIVESPAKAKTINKYLGSDFQVVASYGHVRDLLAKAGSVLPEQDFLIKYEINPKSTRHIKTICDLAKKSECIYLATDPDREGESISWHIVEVLKEKKIFANFKRIIFNEITKKAIGDALQQPRDINLNLVNAQQARRSLDYLVGFSLSPLLWRKLPGCKSAGRVQSVGLRLICEREEEISKFISQEYWNIHIDMISNKDEIVTAKLIEFDGNKLEKFSITNQSQAQDIVKNIENQQFKVIDITRKQRKKSPPPPFITSSLQQEAAGKLGFTAKKTMTIAQKLYEGIDLNNESTALITYMRTDSVMLSKDFIDETRNFISSSFGNNYLPKQIRAFKSKVKNAQEAHEAIRPININLTPELLLNKIEKDYLKLYELIWQRTVACQMENVILNLESINFANFNQLHVAKATGSTIAFDGFYKVYKEINDEEENKKLLPNLSQNEVMQVKNILPKQHFTEPPPRYSEATLVKTLEDLGIGRPSTYATIISVLQERDYVILDQKRFIPQNKGRLVTAFLTAFFKKYVEYDFTAKLEDQLDSIAKGMIEWQEILKNFWTGFNNNVQEIEQYKITDIIPQIETLLSNFLFPVQNGETDHKLCTLCKIGKLSLKLSKYGAFLACDNYPSCNFTRNIAAAFENNDNLPKGKNNKAIGYSDDMQKTIYLKEGPFGWYIQAGEDSTNKNDKPKRVPISVISSDPQDITLETAVKLLALPKVIGLNPNTNKEITVAVGRYGPYLKHDGKFISIPKNYDYLNLSINDCIKIITSPSSQLRKAKKDAPTNSDKVAKSKS